MYIKIQVFFLKQKYYIISENINIYCRLLFVFFWLKNSFYVEVNFYYYFHATTDISGSTRFFSSCPRCLFWYLRFWNQFLIWSSVISRPLANSVRSSRVRYCWREKILSRYWSWRWVKWLRFLLFRGLTPFSMHFSNFDLWLESLSHPSSKEREILKC